MEGLYAPRTRRQGKPASAVPATVQTARPDRADLFYCGVRVDAHPRSHLLRVLRDALAIALQADNAIRPAHRLQEIVAGFRGAELFGNVYQVHERPRLYVVFRYRAVLSSCLLYT